jgi:ArsR family transcriptional regulator, cadmium/lead-responsive transcriptional repressor
MAMIETVGNVKVVEGPEWSALESARCLFHGFGDRSRLAIVQHLLTGDHRVVDLTNHLGLTQGTVSKHLACLRDCGVATVRSEGRASVYSLAHPEATRALLVAAENLLALAGDAVVLCPTFGTAAIEHSLDDGTGSR